MSLMRSAAVVGSMTIISRILGFIRDVLIAGVLGTGLVADAFFVAFRLPNLFRRLFAEGAFNAAFVPLFTKRLEGEGRAQARQFGNEVLSVLTFTLLGFTIAAEIFMPLLVHLLAPGFVDNPEKFDLTVVLTRIAFPYLLFMSLVAFLSGVLNSLGRFAAAAAAPILLNVVLIAVLVFAYFVNSGDQQYAGYLLVWGVAVAGCLQWLMLVIAARRAGMSFKVRRPKLTPAVRRLIVLGIPGVIAGGVTQINIVVGTIIASMQASAVSFLYYAERIYQLPLGVIGIAIGIVLLPEIVRKLRSGDAEAAGKSQNRALEFSMLLTLPAAVALVVIPQPILMVLFQRGAFGPEATMATAYALTAFAFGLPAFVLNKIFSPGFFAREDTKTPMHFAAVAVAINIAVSLALFPYFQHVGIAVATSFAGWINVALLWMTLVKRGHFKVDQRLKSRLITYVVCAACMGAALWLSAQYISPLIAGTAALTEKILLLLVLIATGVVVFFGLCHITGAFKLSEFRARLKRS